MNAIALIKRIGMDILKGAAAALASLIGMVVGGIITGLLGLPQPQIPAYMNTAILMPLMFLSGIFIAIVLGECFQRLAMRFWQRLLALWMCNYILYYLLNLLDGLLFTPMPNMQTGILADLFPALFAAAIIAWLWQPAPGAASPLRLADFFSARKPAEWAWRLAAAWLVFPPIYYLMGRVVALFTLRYYLDPSLNLGLSLPSLETLMLMQVLRGALFLLAVLPIILFWKTSRTALWLWLGAVIFVQIAIQTLLQGYWLPLGLRLPHGLELLADSFIQAYVYTLLHGRNKSQQVALSSAETAELQMVN